MIFKASNEAVVPKKNVYERPVFPEFFLKKDLADVVFKVEGKEFYCHKLILSKASQYFFKMFTSNDGGFMKFFIFLKVSLRRQVRRKFVLKMSKLRPLKVC